MFSFPAFSSFNPTLCVDPVNRRNRSLLCNWEMKSCALSKSLCGLAARLSLQAIEEILTRGLKLRGNITYMRVFSLISDISIIIYSWSQWESKEKLLCNGWFAFTKISNADCSGVFTISPSWKHHGFLWSIIYLPTYLPICLQLTYKAVLDSLWIESVKLRKNDWPTFSICLSKFSSVSVSYCCNDAFLRISCTASMVC